MQVKNQLLELALGWSVIIISLFALVIKRRLT